MDEATEKAIRRLGNRFPFMGGLIRKRAAETLAGTGESHAVKPLITCLEDKNRKVAKAAWYALLNLSGPAMDHLCALWAEKRDKRLEAILLHAGYIASRPLELRSLTAFKTGKRLRENIPEQVTQSCLLDKDRDVVFAAVDYAMDTAGKTAEALWAFALEHPEGLVVRVLHEKGWRPQEASERAIFYFLAGDQEAYHDIDFEQAYLRYWYESGGSGLKEAIASRIRKSGDTRLLAVFRTERGARKGSVTEKEAALQAEILMKNRDYGGLFTLLPFCSYELGEKVIRYLEDAGWQNPDPHGRELQERLEGILSGKKEKGLPPSFAMAIYEDFRPMFMGDKRPPSTDTGLKEWLEDGDFRKRSAALITLAEKGSPLLKDAANKACGDAYWQVRMAAAACEMLRPGTLSPANRAMLEDDHCLWVAALLKMPKSRRLAELGPAGLEELREMPSGRLSDPDHRPEVPDDFFEILKGLVPTGEREYLLTLGEFLGTDIVVSHETAYEAGATDVEIEMED